jgi:hypothetical protein
MMTNIAKQLHTSMNPCRRLIAISALALAVAAPAINTYAQGIPLAGQPGLQELEALAAQKASNANSPMVVAASAKGPAAVADEHAVVEQLASVATCVNCRRLQGAQVIVNLGDLAENRGMEKYIVTLSAEEREQLEAIVSKGSHQSRKIINGLILLNCDASSGRVRRSTQEVAGVLHVSERKIDRVKKRFVEEGYDAALVRPPSQRIYDSKIDGELEARLIALSCGEPPEGHANWSLRLLAQRAVELEYVDSLSHETVRRALKKTN